MKKRIGIFLVVLLVVLGFVKSGSGAESGRLFLPLVHYTLPEPVPTPTPIPGVGSWVFIGGAYKQGGSTIVLGVAASYCTEQDAMKVVKRAWVRSDLVPIEDCDRSGWNPAAPWPPPVFDPPPALPPEFGYGEAFTLELPYNVKSVCSVYYGESNCFEVD